MCKNNTKCNCNGRCKVCACKEQAREAAKRIIDKANHCGSKQ